MIAHRSRNTIISFYRQEWGIDWRMERILLRRFWSIINKFWDLVEWRRNACATLGSATRRKVPPDLKIALINPVTDTQIAQDLKAPGPDGYSSVNFKLQSSNIIGKWWVWTFLMQSSSSLLVV